MRARFLSQIFLLSADEWLVFVLFFFVLVSTQCCATNTNSVNSAKTTKNIYFNLVNFKGVRRWKKVKKLCVKKWKLAHLLVDNKEMR
ncbi:unnamed protein product [Ceratitis capitata]|uniref:(Mediterranean fruit fly) hypothetical protein n=1 Tax=Ceratitis capitata TaxID=7213 RepID=A0A811U1Y7_CERCA|nr:unnamed protein product [Ceratitis capitata]